MRAKVYVHLCGCLFVVLLLSLDQPAVAVTAVGRIIHIGCSNGQVQLDVQTRPDFAYQVQASCTLPSRYWEDALPAVTATNALTSICLQSATPSGFFRILEWSEPMFWYDWKYYEQSSFLSAWGLGNESVSYIHSDRPYSWYIDQADTGPCSVNNCGPAAALMSMKWFNAGSTNTAADARRTYPEDGGWWYTSDVINYLGAYSIPNTTMAFAGAEQLIAMLQEGCITILCINTAYLTTDSNSEHRVGRFYPYASGHFLVVKGYRRVDDNAFFEVYDSNNWHSTYQDKSPKGCNRHLPAAELGQAILNWWPYIIAVHPSAGGGGGSSVAAVRHWPAVNPAAIVHAAGM